MGSKANEQEGAQKWVFVAAQVILLGEIMLKISHSQNPETKQNERTGVNFFA